VGYNVFNKMARSAASRDTNARARKAKQSNNNDNNPETVS